jgi:hypothetical protein
MTFFSIERIMHFVRSCAFMIMYYDCVWILFSYRCSVSWVPKSQNTRLSLQTGNISSSPKHLSIDYTYYYLILLSLHVSSPLLPCSVYHLRLLCDIYPPWRSVIVNISVVLVYGKPFVVVHQSLKKLKDIDPI